MGVILSGILSSVSGKVAGVVGAKWKSVAYLRAYVKPANPDTAAQQVQRTKFKDTVDFAKPLVGQIFNTYTDPFQKNMSGFNYFIKRNIDKFTPTPSYTTVRITEGPLSNPLIGACTYVSPNITIPWTANNGNNGLDGDDTFAAVYDDETGIWYFPPGVVDRSVETMTFAAGSGITPSNFQCYVFCAQYINSVLDKISISTHDQAS